MQADQAENLRVAELPSSNGEAPKSRDAVSLDPPLLWTLEQAAAALSTSPRSLKRAVASGELPPGAVVRPFGRRRLFSRLVLEDWCRRGCPAVRN